MGWRYSFLLSVSGGEGLLVGVELGGDETWPTIELHPLEGGDKEKQKGEGGGGTLEVSIQFTILFLHLPSLLRVLIRVISITVSFLLQDPVVQRLRRIYLCESPTIAAAASAAAAAFAAFRSLSGCILLIRREGSVWIARGA